MAGGQQQSKMASKISRSQDFIGISGFLWDFNLWISVDFRISMGFMEVLWDYFGKNIAFGISDLGFQARFQHLRPRFQLVADPSAMA